MNCGGIARIIGIIGAVLLVSSSAFGQFQVQPMKVVAPVSAGRQTPIDVILESTMQGMTQEVTLSLADITQDANGVWQAIEPGTPIEERADGTKWATVQESDTQVLHLEISKIRSCQSWLRLASNQVTVRPLHRVPARLTATVPSGARGYYCAALLARTFVGIQDDTPGYNSKILLEFVVPIILQIDGRAEQQKVDLVDVGLEFRPANARNPAATLATLSFANNGGTYSLLRGYARIWNKFGGNWRKVTDVEFPKDISMLPGVAFQLKQDTVIPLAAGEYKIEGYAFVDGKQGPGVSKELTFSGDPRVRSTKPGAPLDLDKRDVTLQLNPGQTRSTGLMVANPLDDPITVTIETSLPDHMVQAVVADIRGDQFDCAGWTKATPPQLTLGGAQRANVRIEASMPSSATQANYYATVRFHARHMDGQPAGITECRVCVQNRKAAGSVNVHPQPLKFAQLGQDRYMVTARYLNYGDTPIQPTCQALLTAGNTLDVVRKLSLNCDVLNGSGVLLPLESRDFQAVLELGGLTPGAYRLTTFLTHDREGAQMEPKQVAVVINDGPTGKTIQTADIKDAGLGPVEIKLK